MIIGKEEGDLYMIEFGDNIGFSNNNRGYSKFLFFHMDEKIGMEYILQDIKI